MSGIISLPKTGVFSCYSSGGSLIECAGSGQDGETHIGVAWPSPRFTNNGDGTVTDHLTGLVWMENASAISARTWATALIAANNAADGLYGLSDGSVAGDWRLPNVNEMSSLIAFAYSGPAISNGEGTDRHGDSGTNVFTGIVNNKYWSSTTYTNGSNNRAWSIDLNFIEVGVSRLKTQSAQVWAVKDGSQPGVIALPATGQLSCYNTAGSVISCAGSGQDAEFSKGVSLPEPRFEDNLDGTITDFLTGLIWSKDAETGSITNWDGALAIAASARSGLYGLSDGSDAGDWRLPNIREFLSLVNYNYYALAMSDAGGTGHQDISIPSSLVFQNFGHGYDTWSSNTTAQSLVGAFTMQALTGAAVRYAKNGEGAVWLVKGGIPPEYFWTHHTKQAEPVPSRLYKEATRKVIAGTGDAGQRYIPTIQATPEKVSVVTRSEAVCKRVM